jgi:hypothetical protein
MQSRLNLRIERQIQREKVSKRMKFFTSQQLLQFAPKEDTAMWEMIISRLPIDYSIPDPEFVHLYESSRNHKR